MTTPHGRDIASTGAPIDASKLLATLEAPAYVKRVVLPVTPTPAADFYNARGSIEGERAVKNAFRVQEMGGFSFVEFVSTCNINWKMSILKSKQYAADVLAKVFPPGLFKDKFGVEKR